MDPSNREKRASNFRGRNNAASYHLSIHIGREKTAEMIGRPPLKAAEKISNKNKNEMPVFVQTFFVKFSSLSPLSLSLSSFFFNLGMVVFFFFLPNRLVLFMSPTRAGKPQSPHLMLVSRDFFFRQILFVSFFYKMQTLRCGC